MAAVTAELRLDIERLKTGLEKARSEIKSFKKTAEAEGGELGKAIFGKIDPVGSAGGFLGKLGVGVGLAGVVAGIKSVTSEYRDMALSAEKLGMSVEEFQRLSPVAKKVKVDVESLSGVLLKMEKSLGDPENKALGEALERLGLSAAKLAGMSVTERIVALNQAFHDARGQGTGLHDVSQLVGKGFQDLIPILSMNTDELKKMMDAVNPLSDAFVSQMARIDEAVDKSINNAAKFVKKAIGTAALGFENIFSGLTPEERRKWREAREKEILDETAKALEDEDQRKRDHVEASRRMEEQVKERKAHELSAAGGKLDKLERAGLPDPELLRMDRKELDEIFDTMTRIAGVANEAELMKWARQLQQEGDITALNHVITVLERVRDLNKEIEAIQKRAAEENKKNLQHTAKALEDSISTLEKRRREIEQEDKRDRVTADDYARNAIFTGVADYTSQAPSEPRQELKDIDKALNTYLPILREIRDKIEGNSTIETE